MDPSAWRAEGLLKEASIERLIGRAPYIRLRRFEIVHAIRSWTQRGESLGHAGGSLNDVRENGPAAGSRAELRRGTREVDARSSTNNHEGLLRFDL